MIYLRLFESHSIDNIKKEILYPKIINIINDIIHTSLDFLDTGVRNDENITLPKSIVIGVSIERENGDTESLLGTHFENMETYNEDSDIYWESNDIERLSKINDDIKSNKIKLHVTFSIVVKNNGDLEAVDYQSDIYNRIEEAYPDVEFDTFDPWDLN